LLLFDQVELAAARTFRPGRCVPQEIAMLSWFARRRPAAPTPRAPLFRLARLYALTSAVIGEYLWEERARWQRAVEGAWTLEEYALLREPLAAALRATAGEASDGILAEFDALIEPPAM